jgi:hypothetical protein
MEIIIARLIRTQRTSIRMMDRARAKIKVHTAHITAECTLQDIFTQEVRPALLPALVL